MNLFKHELRANLMSFLIWTGATSLLFFLTVIIYPYIISSADINSMMAMFPEELLKAFNFDLASIATASGWLCSEGLVFYYLVGGLFAAVMGACLVLKEESNKTIEFIYAKPLSKNQILISKIACGVIYIVGFTVIVSLANILALAIIGDLEIGKMLMVLVGPLLIFLSLYGIALLIGSCLRQTKNSTIISCALVFVAYFIQVISVISDKVKFLKYFTVFTLADSRYILQNLQISPWSFLIFALIVSATTALTFVQYNRKEFLS